MRAADARCLTTAVPIAKSLAVLDGLRGQLRPAHRSDRESDGEGAGRRGIRAEFPRRGGSLHGRCSAPAWRGGDCSSNWRCRTSRRCKRHGVQRIVTHCAHCFHVLKNEYPTLRRRIRGRSPRRTHCQTFARRPDPPRPAALRRPRCMIPATSADTTGFRRASRHPAGRLRRTASSKCRATASAASAAAPAAPTIGTTFPRTEAGRRAPRQGGGRNAGAASSRPNVRSASRCWSKARSRQQQWRAVRIKDIAEIVAEALDTDGEHETGLAKRSSPREGEDA